MSVQKRNDAVIGPAQVTSQVVTSNKEFPEGAVRDCIVAAISIKYTQVRSEEVTTVFFLVSTFSPIFNCKPLQPS